MSYRGSRGLVDQVAVAKALDGKGRVDRVRIVARNGPREHVRRSRRRLEAAGAPAAINVKAWDPRLGDDGGAIGRHIDDTAPVAHHAQAAKLGKQLANRIERV